MNFINVRGCNGSGKTTVLRSLARSPFCEVVLVEVPDHKAIPVTLTPDKLAIIGDYTPAAAGSTTAGLDRIKTQAAAKSVIEATADKYPDRIVLFEGVVVSTIFGPWRDWSEINGGMIWAFLDTPLQVCLDRIQVRNGGKPIKEEQVADKHRTLARVRDKAIEAGEVVRDIRWGSALADLRAIIGELK